jgi:acetyl-CoA carboxylase carboxyl transferase subunit beta
MGLFNKKSKEITMRIYKTNQQAHQIEEPAENAAPEALPALPDLAPYRDAAGMWEKCPSCATVLYADDLEGNLRVCMNCGYHFRLNARQRIGMTADAGTFREFNAKLTAGNPLEFPGYPEKLEQVRGVTGEREAVVTGECEIGGHRCVIAVMNGYFQMGSMGAAVGEKFALAAERALKKKLPLAAFTVSGGARMQEGLVSLMQMSKVSAVLGRLDEAGLLYVAVLTDPTTGGVTASFAMLGDITIAEKGALVGFAGRRVIEQTVKQRLPSTFQRAEFLMEKGFIDVLTERGKLKGVLANILRLHAERARHG